MKVVKDLKKLFPAPLNLGLGKAFLTFIYSVIFTKVLNRLSKRGPLFITWLATYDCNVYCKFCSTHILKKQFPEGISLKRAREIAYEIIKAKTYSVGFTGGEVFLWPHLFDVIKILKEHHIVVYIVTNGLLLKEKADEIIENRVDYIIVSIDSDCSKEHDEARNLQGLHERLMQGIGYLKAKRRRKRPLIKSTTVIYRDNLQNLGRILNNLKSIVDVVSAQPIVGGYAYGPHGKDDTSLKPFMFQQNEKEYVEREFSKFLCDNDEFNNDYFRFIPSYWFCKDDLIKKINCWSPFLRLQILPNGDTFHCTANENYPAIGNINKLSIQEIWSSPEMIRQREEIRLQKNNCICWTQDASFNAFINMIPYIKMLPNFNKK